MDRVFFERVQHLNKSVSSYDLLYWSHNYYGFREDYKASISGYRASLLSGKTTEAERELIKNLNKIDNLFTINELEEHSYYQYLDLKES